MQLNGGKIKEVQVSLLLSSRAEMQKVIEKARQATSTSFMNKISAPQQPVVLSAATIANQFAKKIPDQAAPVVPPQPPVISLTNFLTQSMQQQSSQPPVVAQGQQQQLNLMSAYQTMQQPDFGVLSSATPALQMGLPQNAAAAAAAYAKYYATLIDPTMLNYTNPLTAGLNENPKDSQRDISSRNSDPRNLRSNSRDRNSFRRHRSRSNERNPSRRSRSPSRERYTDSDKEGKESGGRLGRRSRFSAATDKAATPNMSAIPPNLKQPGMHYGAPPPMSNNVWEHPPPQVAAAQLNNANAYQNFNNGNSSLPPTRHYQTESKSSSSAYGDIGTCVKVTNVDNDTFYSDLRKFFFGLPIGTHDIKFLTDGKGNRTGIALVRFLSSDSKKQALTKSMYPLKSTQVIITSITEEDFESGLLNSNKSGGNRQSNFNNYRNEDRHDMRNDRFRDRSDSRERDQRDHNNRNFNRYDGNNRQNNRFEGPRQQDRQNNNRDQDNRDQGNNRRGNFRNDDQREQEKVYKPDENFTVLIIDDIPRTANEPDIFEAFPNILSITINRYTAYVKFTSHEAAKVILENRFIHYIRNKRVFFEPGSEAQFNDLARKLGKQDNPELNQDMNQGSGDNGNDGNDNQYDNMNDDTNHSSNSNSRDNSRNSFESRDPRQKNFSNDRFGNNGPPNTLKTDCVIMKNMEPDTNIADVEEFFKDIGIFKMRVHILLDKKGLFDDFKLNMP